MGSDTEHITEEYFEHRLTSGHIVGQAAAYENLAQEFGQRAGELFTRGKDDMACFMRDLAKEMVKKGKAMRERQHKLNREWEERQKEAQNQ